MRLFKTPCPHESCDALCFACDDEQQAFRRFALENGLSRDHGVYQRWAAVGMPLDYEPQHFWQRLSR